MFPSLYTNCRILFIAFFSVFYSMNHNWLNLSPIDGRLDYVNLLLQIMLQWLTLSWGLIIQCGYICGTDFSTWHCWVRVCVPVELGQLERNCAALGLCQWTPYQHREAWTSDLYVHCDQWLTDLFLTALSSLCPLNLSCLFSIFSRSSLLWWIWPLFWPSFLSSSAWIS